MINTQMAYLAALLLLAAILSAGVQAAVAAEEQTLTMSVGKIGENATDPTFDRKVCPDTCGTQEYHTYTHWEPLITLDMNAKILPWAAESYGVSDDYRTITFHLRKGVKFADGTPLNASVLKFNFDRIVTIGMKNYKNAYNVLKYYDYSEASDEYTFMVHFTEGSLDMPFELAVYPCFGMFISPSDISPAWDIKGTLNPGKMFNGLGPYYMDENESIPNQAIVLKRRHSWRDDYDFHKPKLDKIVLKLIKDPQVAAMALENGEIDYICRYWNVPLDSLPSLEENPRITIITYPETRMYFIRTAWWKEPFNGTEGILLRKAISYALERKNMVEGAFNGYALPATDAVVQSPQRPDVPECCGKGYDYDLNKANQYLAEAGWIDTNGDGILDKNGKPLHLDLVCTSSSTLIWQKDLALIVQSQLKKIGIDIKIRTLEYSEFLQTGRDGTYDLRIGYNGGGGIPLANELSLFNLTTGTRNYYEDQNGTLKTIVEKARIAADREERDNSMCQICNILYDEAGLIPLVYEMQYAVMNSKVKGFKIGPSQTVYCMDHVEECWIE
jgi:peptide/nickel transport system substrate-binding protein